MDNLTGFWHFKEEFDFGKKEGEARLFQNGDKISGSLVFREMTDSGESLIVHVTIKGLVSKDTITINDSGYTVLAGGIDTDYIPEEREGVLNIQGQIVGSVLDKDAIGGVFVMNKLF